MCVCVCFFIGLAQYSGDPRIEWHLNSFSTKDAVIDAVKNLPYKGGNTLTGVGFHWYHQFVWHGVFLPPRSLCRSVFPIHAFFHHSLPGLALTYILENCFKPESGSRVGVPKIGILITDGKSQDDVIPPAESLRNTGVELFAIGKDGHKIHICAAVSSKSTSCFINPIAGVFLN